MNKLLIRYLYVDMYHEENLKEWPCFVRACQGIPYGGSHVCWDVFKNIDPAIKAPCSLTHCGLVTPCIPSDIDISNIDQVIGLLPGCIKPLPEPMLTYHLWGPLAFMWSTIEIRSEDTNQQNKIKNWFLCIHISFPRPTELTHLPLVLHHASVNQVSIGSDNGLSPIRRQAII